MDSSAELTLNNLHVLGALSHNDKLLTNDDAFGIYVPTTLRALVRTWYGERRAQNVQRVRQTVRAGVAFASRALEDANALLARGDVGADAAMRLRAETAVVHHTRMMEALGRARDGLGNLRETYRDDAALLSQITVVIEEVAVFERVMAPHSAALRGRCAAVAGAPTATAGAPPPPPAPPPASPPGACDG
jgi:hypothetical protein